MANIQFSAHNRADGATLSGGSYEATLPRTNLQQTDLALPARTTSAAESSTRIDLDFGNASTVVRLWGLMRHTCTTDATYRLTGGTTGGASDVYDSGTLPVWPRIYGPLDLDFEEPDWYTGQISAADAAVYPIKLLHDIGSNVLCRYWRLQVSDTGNPAGYVEMTRLWAGPVWSPAVNYQPGGRLMWEPRDRAVVSRSGARYAERADPARVFNVQFDSVTDGEAFGRVLDMARRLGSEGEVVVIPDPANLTQRHRRDILARIRRADGAAQARYGLQTASFELEERL